MHCKNQLWQPQNHMNKYLSKTRTSGFLGFSITWGLEVRVRELISIFNKVYRVWDSGSGVSGLEFGSCC